MSAGAVRFSGRDACCTTATARGSRSHRGARPTGGKASSVLSSGMALRRRRAPAPRAQGAEDEEAKVYDYSTEKVRNLLKRDIKESRGLQDLAEEVKDLLPSEDDVEEARGDEEPVLETASTTASKPEAPPSPSVLQPKVASPFGGSKVASPFASPPASPGDAPPPSPSSSSFGSQKMMSPFKTNAKDMDFQSGYDEDLDRPWWQIQITATQIFIVFSFTTLIALMLFTFAIVVKTGAVRFNDV